MLYHTHHTILVLKMLFEHDCPITLDSEMQAELNRTTKDRLTMAFVSHLMLWQNAYTQISKIRHKASYLMQDILKKQKNSEKKEK